ncbi:hypothetical protein ACLQ2Q_15915 [Microbacterium sp. DT81.1]|uniref:hypothetical protein n=1 Tax=Microbacterium sp. DT81.1 TaxID=3393413 RepID=UPI003CF5712D
MIPQAHELSDWARLEEQKQIEQERIRWRVMRKTPMGRVSLVIGVIVSLFVVAIFAFVIFSIVMS